MAKTRPPKPVLPGPPWFLMDRSRVVPDVVSENWDPIKGGLVCQEFAGGRAVLLFSDRQWAADYICHSANPDLFPARSDTFQAFTAVLEDAYRKGSSHVALDYSGLGPDERANLAPIDKMIASIRAAHSECFGPPTLATVFV